MNFWSWHNLQTLNCCKGQPNAEWWPLKIDMYSIYTYKSYNHNQDTSNIIFLYDTCQPYVFFCNKKVRQNYINFKKSDTKLTQYQNLFKSSWGNMLTMYINKMSIIEYTDFCPLGSISVLFTIFHFVQWYIGMDLLIQL